MSSSPPNTLGPEQKPLIPQQGQRMRNVMIDDDLDDPIPRSNPTFETSQRFLNETRDDTLPPTLPGPSSMFQRAREVDIGGNPSFVNGNVYHYNHYNHVTRNLAQISSIEFAARRSERRADIIKQLGEEVNELNQLLREKDEELSRMEDTANMHVENLKRLKAEVGKLNQLLHEKTEELLRMEDTSNRQIEKLKRLEGEVEKLNQLLQEKTKELLRMENASNRQEEKLKQLEREVGKLNQLLQEKTAEFASLEEAAKGRNEKQIRILEERVSGMIQQKEKHEEEIRGLRSKVPNLVEDMNLLKTQYEEELRGLQAEVSNFVDIKAKYEEEIRGLKAQGREDKEEIERLEAEIFRMRKIEDLQKREYKEEIEHLGGKHDKEIQRLEAIVADKGEQVLKLEKELECLKPKVSGEEEVNQPKTRQARDPTKSPDEKPIDSSQPPLAQATNNSSTAATEKIDGLDQEQGIKNEQNKSLLSTSAFSKQTSTPQTSPQTVTPEADSLSVIDVVDLVKALNAEIGTTVHLITELLCDLEPLVSDESEIDLYGLRNHLGSLLCDKLRKGSKAHPLITQLTLQMGLTWACSTAVNISPFWWQWYDKSMINTYNRIAMKEGEVAADEWRSKGSDYLDLPQCEGVIKKYLTEVLLKLASAAVRGTLKSIESLLSQYNQQVEAIAKLAAKLHKTITEEVTSEELGTFVARDIEYNASHMEVMENNYGSIPDGNVIGTHEMGLICRKRVEPKKPRGSYRDWDASMKAKVVLASTVESYKRK